MKKARLNWEKIDNELVQKIKIVCKEIFNSPEKLVRVSITEIIKKVGHKNWIEKRHLKLPKTAELIERKLETLEEFMLRKEVLNGVLWILRSGARWCDLPERFPPYQTCHRRFHRMGQKWTIAKSAGNACRGFILAR